MSKIIVGVDQSEGSNDAIALASSLAGITGAELMLVNVFPYDIRPSRALNAEFEAYLRKDSNELLERLRGELDLAPRPRRSPIPRPPMGCMSSPSRRTRPSSWSAPPTPAAPAASCPAAPRSGCCTARPARSPSPPRATAPGAEPGIVGCGFDGSQSAQRALQAAEQIAAATGARLRVIRAFQPLKYDYPPKGVMMGGIAYNDKLQERASEELDAAVATLQGTVRAEKFFAVGNAGEILAGATEQLDLLLVGSRGYGPLHSVVVGGVAGRVVREAACPVIVLPRKARHVEEDSLFAEAVPRARLMP